MEQAEHGTRAEHSRPLRGIVLTPARGRRRMLEIAAEDEAARQAEIAKLVADLGRRPSTRELVLIEQIAVQVVRCRKLLAKGRHNNVAECTRLITRALGKLGLPPPPPPPRSWPTSKVGAS